MRLIPCRKIREGMELARDVVTGPPGTAPLLRTGVLLSERYAKALPLAGIGSVWIEDDLGRDIDVVEPLTPETRERVHRATGDALDAARNALRNGAGLPDSVVASLAEVADALVADLLEIPEAALTLDDLGTFDAYTHRHSVQVAVLGLLIARRAWTREGWIDYRGRRRYDRFGDRMRKLGVGLLVHDVGKLAVPPEVLNKPARLTADEMAVMRTHPEAGVELLRAADLSPLTVSVIRDHHERPDGTGYPNGLKGTAIHEFARFAAVADVYDAVTSKRVYSGAVQPHVGVGIVRSGAGTQFCTDVVRHFRAVVMPYPVGHEVTLPDGRRGVVAAVDPLDPDHPTVRVPSGRTIEEIRVDMTAPPAVLAENPDAPLHRARLAR
jgi:HD-GYP domain-containing protein (c-di-GMP phosphodiesterase class II)